jgi:ABC-type glycerol-3-phosphate transport system substrate-binding protein
MTARGTLAALLVLALAGCGGSDKPAPAKQTKAPAEEGAPAPSSHTPESCMLKEGLESIEKRAKTWSAFHPDGYAVRVQKFGSPAAAHKAVEAATGIADQANFFGVFGPAEDRENGATLAVARCLRAF